MLQSRVTSVSGKLSSFLMYFHCKLMNWHFLVFYSSAKTLSKYQMVLLSLLTNADTLFSRFVQKRHHLFSFSAHLLNIDFFPLGIFLTTTEIVFELTPISNLRVLSEYRLRCGVFSGALRCGVSSSKTSFIHHLQSNQIDE